MNCSYCHQEKLDGQTCLVCGVFVCRDCISGDAFYDISGCVECERMICKDCVSFCRKCSCCEGYICTKCEDGLKCDYCMMRVCNRCCDYVGFDGVYYYICDCCSD